MPKTAALLVNLGSPESTSVQDVRRYLREFLGDERVLDLPKVFRWLLLEGIILRTRPKKSAHAYASVWTPAGSPLLVTSRSVRDKLAATLGNEVPVYLAMRYGQPSIAAVLSEIVAAGVTELLLVPQYPHYAMSSWETVVAKVYAEAQRLSPTLRVTTVQPFFGDSDYIDALYQSAQPFLAQEHDYLLFSFHGIPVRHLRKADSSKAHCTLVNHCCDVESPAHATCYRAQCLRTTRAFAARAGLKEGKYSVSFQSRLAGEPWLSPYTDHELTRLPSVGVKNLLVMTPAFVTDCLETLEEIAVTGKKTFQEAGGKGFQQVPCLNDHPAYIEFLARRIRTWLQSLEATNVVATAQEPVA